MGEEEISRPELETSDNTKSVFEVFADRISKAESFKDLSEVMEDVRAAAWASRGNEDIADSTNVASMIEIIESKGYLPEEADTLSIINNPSIVLKIKELLAKLPRPKDGNGPNKGGEPSYLERLFG